MQIKHKLENSIDQHQETQKLSDVAYSRVLESLFSRKIKAGSFVSQATLVKILDVPVQPLRDALRLLEAEGVVCVHPRSGIEFTKADLELARSTYQFRTIIERAAARHTATAGDIAYFTELASDHQALIKNIEAGEFGDGVHDEIAILEQRFHGGMLDTLANPLIATSARRLQNYVRLIRLESLITPPLILLSLKEHQVILQAIIARDADAAEEALTLHFQYALQRVLRMF